MVRRIEGTEAIEVYVSDNGYICIKQDDFMGDEPRLVTMLPLHVPLVIRWLQEAAAQVEGEVVGVTRVGRCGRGLADRSSGPRARPSRVLKFEV